MYKWFIHFKYLSSVGAMNMNMPGHVAMLGCSWFCNHNCEYFFVLTDAHLLSVLLEFCQCGAIYDGLWSSASWLQYIISRLPWPLSQNKSWCATFHMEMHFTTTFIVYHIKGCAPGLALMKGAKGNWGMACYCRHSCTPWKLSKPFWLIIGK